MKQAQDLGPLDFAVYPVWEFAPEVQGIDECSMIPVIQLPVENLDQRCVGTRVRLADGSTVWAVIYDLWPSTLDGTIESQTFQFINGESTCNWPEMEFQPATMNSVALAHFFARSVEEFFPFAYDVSRYVAGDVAVTKRSVSSEEENKKYWRNPPDPALVDSILRKMKQ